MPIEGREYWLIIEFDKGNFKKLEVEFSKIHGTGAEASEQEVLVKENFDGKYMLMIEFAPSILVLLMIKV